MKSKSIFLFYVALSLFITDSIGQNIAESFQLYHSSHHTEKIFVHTDNSYYFPESTIYGKVYLVHGTDHQLIDTTILIHVQLVNREGEIMQRHILESENGTADFALDTDLNYLPGKYYLKAYTQYQRNFDDAYIFQKEILIANSPEVGVNESIEKEDSLTIDFFPEGGHLVQGIESKVAFKIMGNDTESQDIVGVLRTSDGTFVDSVKTTLGGIGIFTFTPEVLC